MLKSVLNCADMPYTSALLPVAALLLLQQHCWVHVAAMDGLGAPESALPPNGQGCTTIAARRLPYCNHTLPDDIRIADLLSRMTLDEKATHLWGSGSHKDNVTFPGVPRIGLPGHDWGFEAQHGLRTGCVAAASPTDPEAQEQHCPTTFPAPTALGCTFNDTLIKRIGQALGTEARAMNNLGTQTSGRSVLRTPVINLIRDPRWGRNVECPTEDPVHAGMYGAAMVNGVQTMDSRGRLLAGVQMKHFAVYQVEDCGGGGTSPGIPSEPACSRMKFDANISASELNETYFVPWRTAVLRSDSLPTGYMCSYNAVNGVPACASKMLSDAIRGWGFEGYCGTDCSAADGIFDAHGFANDLPNAYADAINGGTDLICNPHNMTALHTAVSTGLIKPNVLDQALRRAFGVLFRIGLFDPVDEQPFTKIPIDEMGSVEHHKLALQAARQSTVLLVNRRSTLPMQKEKIHTIAVIGPQGNATGQIAGNYVGNECSDGVEIWPNNGDMSGGGGQDSWWPCVPTVAQALRRVAGPAVTVQYSQGCEQRCSGTLEGNKNISTKSALLNPSVCNAADLAEIDEAVALTMKTSDLIVLALGFDTAIAGEGHDRIDIGLPGAQEQLALGVLEAVAKRPPTHRPKVVLLLLAGSSVSIDGLLNHTALDAVIAGHQPGLTGGTAAAELIFGQQNDLGKLSYTVYPRAYQNEISIADMSFRTSPGRTHRFYTGQPLFSYGSGLSLTVFALSSVQDSAQEQSPKVHFVNTATTEFTAAAMLSNVGSMAGSSVAFAWFGPSSAQHHEVLAKRLGQAPPQRMLAGYTRSDSLNVGESQRLDFRVDVADLDFVDTSGVRVLPAGEYVLQLDLGPKAMEPDHEVSWAGELIGEVLQTVLVERDLSLAQ